MHISPVFIVGLLLANAEGVLGGSRFWEEGPEQADEVHARISTPGDIQFNVATHQARYVYQEPAQRRRGKSHLA